MPDQSDRSDVSDRFALEAQEIVKTFPGVRALDRVSFDLKPGEVHALVGENGAGKSTLMHVLGGVYQPDSGRIRVNGEEVKFADPHDASRRGIGVVFQELSLSENLSIAENIFANRQPLLYANLIDWWELYAHAEDVLRLFDWEIDPRTPVAELSTARRQVVEILKAIAGEPSVLILDEPTSSLTAAETEMLFKNIGRLKAEGQSVIYISHHLGEVFQVADRVTVLRDGKLVETCAIQDVTEEDLVRKMVGRELSDMYGSRTSPIGPERFRLEVPSDRSDGSDMSDMTLSVRAGEIVGIAGLAGAGRTELARAIFGLETLHGGRMFLDGQPVSIRSPEEAIAARIAYMSEDRKDDGLFLEMTIRENCAAPSLRDFAGPLGLVDESAMTGFSEALCEQFGVVTPSAWQKVGLLSGGNQQKVLLAMWIGIRPLLLIADEPTRGVDVGAKSEIYHLLRELAADGVSIIMISSDLPEILGLSDRILVMRNGRIVGEFPREEATEEKIIEAAVISDQSSVVSPAH